MADRVRLLRRARIDVQETTDWIAKRSKPGARSWVAALNRVLDSIDQYPESFAVAEEDYLFPFHTIREFYFKTRRGRKYRGLFVVIDDEKQVLRIRGSGQDLIGSDDVDLPDVKE